MANTGEDDELYRLLFRHLVWEPLDNDAIKRAILKNPDGARQMYLIYPEDTAPVYPLFMAARVGTSLEVLELIYDAHPEAIRHKNCNSLNVLHVACLFNAAPLEVVDFLVGKHPDSVKAKDKFGRTPLHFACYAIPPKLHIIRLLVERHPSAVHMNDDSGRTPLQILRASNSREDRQNSDPWLEAVSEPLGTVTDSYSSNEQMIAVARKFSDMNWTGGVHLVLDARPTLVHSMNLPHGTMPKVLSLMGRRCKLSTVYSAIRGEPDLLQCARALRRSKRKRSVFS